MVDSILFFPFHTLKIYILLCKGKVIRHILLRTVLKKKEKFRLSWFVKFSKNCQKLYQLNPLWQFFLHLYFLRKNALTAMSFFAIYIVNNVFFCDFFVILIIDYLDAPEQVLETGFIWYRFNLLSSRFLDFQAHLLQIQFVEWNISIIQNLCTRFFSSSAIWRNVK